MKTRITIEVKVGLDMSETSLRNIVDHWWAFSSARGDLYKCVHEALKHQAPVSIRDVSQEPTP